MSGSPQSDSGGTLVRWVASLMLVQTVSRGVHFALNLVVIRHMAPADYGVAALQLPLVSMAATRVLKEALHRLCVRQDAPEDAGTASSRISGSEARALLWWGIVIGIVVSGTLSGAFLSLRADKFSENDVWIKSALYYWLVSAWGELLSEPVVVELERRAVVGPTVMVEVAALFTQSVVTLFGFSIPGQNVALVTAAAHMAYGVVLCVGYWFTAWRKQWLSQLFPLSKDAWRIDRSSLLASSGFLAQSLGKFVTAEGEAMILFALGTEEQQGVFQFVANLGSIVARIFFQSIERTAFVMFAGAASRVGVQAAKNERLAIWNVLMRVSVTIALLYLATCPPFIRDLVFLVYGAKWGNTDAPILLSVFGLYLLLMAVNGLTEAFRDAVVPYQRLQQQSLFSLAFMLLYFLIGSIAVSQFGALGLIVASCINTLLRWAFSSWYFRQWLPPLLVALPSPSTWLVCFSASVAGFLSRDLVNTWAPFFGVYSHLFVGGGGVGAALLLWLGTAQLAELKRAWGIIKTKSD